LRHFLTPALFRQAHEAHEAHGKHRDCRWGLHALVVTLAVFTWCAGDSQQERFEVARAFYVDALAPKRKRPGKTVEGFRAALARLPMAVLRLFAAGLRRALLCKLGPWLTDGGFIPIGVDGSRLCCPRTAELEKRLGTSGKKGGGKKKPTSKRQGNKGGKKKSAKKQQASKRQASKKEVKQQTGVPQLWLTAMVHLTTGLPWSWRLGKADASERDHLLRLLATLPQGALVVADAGFPGADVIRHMINQNKDFLLRVGSKNTLLADLVPTLGWANGVVMLWTKRDQDAKKLPLFLRLIRVCQPGKADVWLLTNVLQPARLSVEQASRFYRLRWESEGFFRTFKKTMKQVKLAGRTVRQVHREAEGALVATQLLLAQGAVARAALSSKDIRCSPRGLLLEVRREIREGHNRRGRSGFRGRLAKAGREDRPNRKSGKVARPWPTRDDHKPPKPPDIRTMSDELISKLHKLFGIT
jgi:hypothetical protein